MSVERGLHRGFREEPADREPAVEHSRGDRRPEPEVVHGRRRPMSKSSCAAVVGPGRGGPPRDRLARVGGRAAGDLVHAGRAGVAVVEADVGDGVAEPPVSIALRPLSVSGIGSLLPSRRRATGTATGWRTCARATRCRGRGRARRSRPGCGCALVAELGGLAPAELGRHAEEPVMLAVVRLVEAGNLSPSSSSTSTTSPRSPARGSTPTASRPSGGCVVN